ncbi:MAG: SDR family oxidoreductase [Paracoccaceae bacterium]|nr:SDR family oxidoreductase [Paracoccaceae bacterium]
MSLNSSSGIISFKDKIIIITGGASGIGKHLAQKFAKCGARVVIADLSLEKASSVAKPLNGVGFLCDVTKEEQIQNLIRNVKKIFGTVDIFVSNAGICLGEGAHSASASNEIWNSSWEVNVMAHVYAARATLPEMIKNQRGQFVQIISAAALLSQIGDAAYSATKHAAMGFAESLAITHKSDGIDVSVLCPQYVATNMLGYEEDRGDPRTEIMSAAQLAEIAVPEIQKKKFLILPHPEVRQFMNFKNKSYDKWIYEMHKLRARVLKKSGTLDIKTLHKFV